MSSSEVIVEEKKDVEVVYIRPLDDSSEEPPPEEWESLMMTLEEENVKRVLYELGQYDPGSGEICTKYVAQSASSVLRHPYYDYPGLTDPGIVEALTLPPPVIDYPDDGQELYLALCKQMKIFPIRLFYRQLLEKKIDLRYYGINPPAFRAMGKALERNRFVESLDLTDNWMSVDGCLHIGEMLTVNNVLTELNLTGCRIGVDGARNFLTNLATNQTLEKINLSKNQLGDEGVTFLVKLIFQGTSIAYIDISFNNLTGKTLLNLSEAFETHNKLKYLNLSWNSILSPNAVYAMCQHLSVNPVFEELNLARNSLAGNRVGIAIKILLKNPNIRAVILNNNKLTGLAVRNIVKNLELAKKLETLDLSNNPMTTADALKLLTCLDSKKVKLRNLLLDNVTVDDDFIEQKDFILSKKGKKDVIVTWGDVRKKFVPKLADMREIAFNRCEAICKKSKKREVDIALVIQEIYKENKEPMDPRYFYKKLITRGAFLDLDLVELLARMFAGPPLEKSKSIDLALVLDYLKRKWPDRKLPPTPPEPEPEPPKPKSKKKKK